MKERSILFNAPMVRAIIDDRKTQVRRAIRKQFAADADPAEVPATSPEGWQITGHSGLWWDDAGGCIYDAIRCHYGKPGDRLWVREAFAIVPRTAYRCSEGVQQTLKPDDDHDAAIYREGWERSSGGIRWRPSIHMPRWASRILLEVVSVRVERLQDISEADAIAEGTNPYLLPAHPARENLRHVDGYRLLWESINGPGSWDANPWVWVIEFRRIESS